MINVETFKGKIEPKLHGSSLAKLAGGFFDKMHEAAGNFFSNVKPYTVIRRARIANAIYDKVYNYACEDDLEADSVIDIRPVGPRSSRDSLQGSFMQQFDIKKKENTFEVEYINGVKTLRLSKCLTPRTTLYEADSLDIGATVTASGDAGNLALDYQDFVSGNASVSFDLTGSTGQGKITIVLDNTVDISTLEGLGAMFAWLKFSLASALTNYKLRLGTGTGDYYESTVTSAISGAFQDDAWQLMEQNLATATKTGSPDFAAINWIQIEINYTSGTARSGKLDNVSAALGQAWEVVYYSNRLFTDAAGTTWKEIPTLDTDIIRLEGPQTINAYVYEFMLTLQQELKGKNMDKDFAFFTNALNGRASSRGGIITSGIYDALQRKWPNQAVVRQIDYFNFADLDGEGGEGPGSGGTNDDW